jgi:hypothetical protein
VHPEKALLNAIALKNVQIDVAGFGRAITATLRYDILRTRPARIAIPISSAAILPGIGADDINVCMTVSIT